MNFDHETVEEARDRGGEAADERPDRIEEALETEKVGYVEGEALVGDYQSYPSRESLTRPSKGDFIRELLSHPKVGSLDGAVSELTAVGDSAMRGKWYDALESAAEAHSLDIDTLLEKGVEERGEEKDRLGTLLGYEPHEAMVERDNPLLIAELYALGLSAAEVADVLEDSVDGDVREVSVRDTLKDMALLSGKTRTEQKEAFENNKGRLGGTTIHNKDAVDTGESGGLTVNASDYA